MHWDFYTVSAVISGISLIIAVAAFGTALGTGGQRFGIAVFGVLCIGYGVYVAKQTSGIYFFPVQIIFAPILLLVLVIARIVKRPGTPQSSQVPMPGRQSAPVGLASKVEASSPGFAAAGSVTSAPTPSPRSEAQTLTLRTAQPPVIREAVVKQGASFIPRFAIIRSDPENPLYRRSDLELEWSVKNNTPVLQDGEEILATWFAAARLKVAIGRDLRPSEPASNVTWVTTFDGPGSVVLTKRRLMGIVRAGESLLGAVGQDAGQSIVLWSVALEQNTSVTTEQIGTTSALLISAQSPGGHLYLSNLKSAESNDDGSVTPGEAAELVNTAKGSVKIDLTKMTDW